MEKNIAQLPPHGEKGSKKAFNDEKASPPPWGDKRSNKAPFLFHNLYTTANAIYQLDIRFWPLIAQIYFFYLSPTALIGQYSPFLFFIF